VTLPEGAAYCPSCGQPVAPTTIAGAPQGSGIGGSATAVVQSKADPVMSQAAQQARATVAERGPQKGGPEDYGVYALIRRDQSPLAKETLQLIDSTGMRVHPRFSAFLGSVLRPTFQYAVLVIIALGIVKLLKLQVPLGSLPVLLVVPIVIVVAKLIEIKTTTITVEGGRLLVSKGVFSREEHNIELYRVLDIALQRSFLNRLTGDGTLIVTVEGIHGNRDPYFVPLPGLAKIGELEELFKRLRSLVLLLRTGPWGKGLIY
jgi:uncharacterized membrane protein YdbT with pleckstrin-like domain